MFSTLVGTLRLTPPFLPHFSVYVRNLEERVKPEVLRETLRTIFSEYGNVIDIVAKTSLKAKGQAFVVFDNPESALNAIEDVQGFDLFDKPMHLALARTRSDATVLKTGNDEEFDAHKRRRMAEKGMSPVNNPVPVNYLTFIIHRQEEGPRNRRRAEAA
jgi:RNA recognition motif-containing protein